jgi:hypothetical protein
MKIRSKSSSSEEECGVIVESLSSSRRRRSGKSSGRTMEGEHQWNITLVERCP